jgi:hypothetical protein
VPFRAPPDVTPALVERRLAVAELHTKGLTARRGQLYSAYSSLSVEFLLFDRPLELF